MITLEQPRKVTVVESIVEQIVRQIQAGNLKPGDRLPSEREMIEMLGVSRSSVREALQGLVVMGLVESRPGRGSFVTGNLSHLVPNLENPALPAALQREMRLKLIEARRIVEGDVAELAAERATESATTGLRRTFEAYRELIARASYGQALDRAHHDFHLGLAEMTQNPFFPPVVETLLRAVPKGLRESEFNSPGDPDPAAILRAEIEIHLAILEAVERRDGPAARQAVEAHMEFERRLIVQVFGDG